MNHTTNNSEENGNSNNRNENGEQQKNATMYAEVVDNMKSLKIDGIPNIIKSRFLCMSIVWLCALLVCLCVCVWLIVGTFNQYFANKVTTTTRHVDERVSVFPSVTFCNMNPFSTAYAFDLIATANLTSYVTDVSTGSLRDNLRAYLALQEHMSRTRNGSLLTDAEKAMFAEPDMTLLLCQFNGKACLYRDLQRIFHPYYMNCLRFNANGSLTVNTAGEQSQLSIALYAGLPDNLTETVFYRGFNVFIQNASDDPFALSTRPVQVTPGFGAIFTPRRLFYTQSPYPFSECSVRDDNTLTNKMLLVDRSLFDEVVRTGYAYAQQTCMSFCMQRLNARYCGCLDASINYSLDYKYAACMSSETLTCLSDLSDNFTSDSSLINECYSLCPLECNRNFLVNSVNYYRFPYSDTYAYYLKSTVLANMANDTEQNLKAQKDFVDNFGNNVVEFRLFYESLAYTSVEEEPKMSGEDLLGSLGGHLHLFLGMSLLSFAEIVELVVMFLALFVYEKRQR